MDIHARDDIHLGFLGLCFASLDEIGGMNNLPPANLVEALCPTASRVNPLHLHHDWFH